MDGRPPLPGAQVRAMRHEFGWYRGRQRLSSQCRGEGAFLLPRFPHHPILKRSIHTMKQQLEVIRAAALDAIAETRAAEDLAALLL